MWGLNAPRFYSVYRDIDIRYGGLWFDPWNMEFVEVINLDDAAGVESAWLIIRGRAYIDEESIMEGLETIGQEHLADKVITAFRRKKPPLNMLLKAAEATYAYKGMGEPPDESHIVIQEGTPAAEKPETTAMKWRVRPENIVITTSPESTIWEVLEQLFGISPKV